MIGARILLGVCAASAAAATVGCARDAVYQAREHGHWSWAIPGTELAMLAAALTVGLITMVVRP